MFCQVFEKVNQFFSTISKDVRKKFKNDKLINTILPTLSMSIEQAYTQFCDADGFLYMNLVAENTFG
mgnify:CR=1 FL=1